MVIGIGMNTNQKQFTKELENRATSIKNEFGIDVENNKVISKFCELLEEKIMGQITIYTRKGENK